MWSRHSRLSEQMLMRLVFQRCLQAQDLPSSVNYSRINKAFWGFWFVLRSNWENTSMSSNNIHVSHLSWTPSKVSGFLNWSVWFLFFSSTIYPGSQILDWYYNTFMFCGFCLSVCFSFKLNSSPSLSVSNMNVSQCRYSMISSHDLLADLQTSPAAESRIKIKYN